MVYLSMIFGNCSLISAVGDGGTYALDVAGKKTANGTNMNIYTYNGGINQQFMLTENSDGSYIIRTAVTDGNSVVEVEDASKVSGANVQQWAANGASCQNWILEAVADPGCSMDPNVIYTFRNGNSGLVMDIANGKMNDGTNVQQWDSNGLDCQKWTLQAFGSGNYYWIRPVQDNGYALRAENNQNGGNISLAAYSKKDSSQLFRFTKNPDGSYGILSHTSGDTKYVEVAGASKENGANVQQWEPTGSSCQKWQAATEVTTTATTTTQTTVTSTTRATTTTTGMASGRCQSGWRTQYGRCGAASKMAACSAGSYSARLAAGRCVPRSDIEWYGSCGTVADGFELTENFYTKNKKGVRLGELPFQDWKKLQQAKRAAFRRCHMISLKSEFR